LLAVFLAASARPATAGVKVFGEAALRESIHAGGFARILVGMKAPETTRFANAAFLHKAVIPGRRFSRSAVNADKALSDYIHSMVGQVVSGLHAASYKINRTYDYFPVIAMDISAKALDALESSPLVSSIMEDRPVPLPEPVDAESSPAADTISPCSSKTSTDVDIVGARSAWAEGYTGTGWYVAVLDSGILTNHELFAGKNIVEACFSRTDDCPNGQSEMFGPGAARPYSSLYDGYEHGTHVAGIAAGNGGSVFGVAKDADIVAVQIFSPFNASECGNDSNEPCVMTWDSDQLAALDYILTLRGTYPIAAINMSIGGDQYSDQASCDADNDNPFLKDAIDKLRNAGIATVSVSGNDSSCDSIEAPGCISSAVAVGAVDDNDREAFFNDWQYSMLDLLAPGVQIVSAVPDSPSSCKYLSGTSMAAPQVTGAWAILKQKDPSASVSDILHALESTGLPVRNSPCSGISGILDTNDYKPRIDVASALSPFLIPVPSIQASLDYAATDSPVLNVFHLPYPIGVGPVAGSGDIVNLRVGLYAFAGPVDIYVAVYVPGYDPDNYYVLTADDRLEPLATRGLVPWKRGTAGPVDESLFGEILKSELPLSTYYVYLLVTPPGRTDAYYLWSTSFVNNGL
jgi:subtilisin family serine protease